MFKWRRQHPNEEFHLKNYTNENSNQTFAPFYCGSEFDLTQMILCNTFLE